jgi:small subunit ribosomal protein S6|nr:30S ribosomal protein S6 [Hyphomonas sp.]|tara:strand:- start:160496 stop:160936 length:441 start_codon:yes stop_codon:yes gene_type:complete
MRPSLVWNEPDEEGPSPGSFPLSGAAWLYYGTENMALYEHVVITRPDISPAQVETFVEELSGFLKEKGASVGKTEYWGLRNLAYPIKKQRKGHYSLLNIDGPADAVQELERRLRISDDVMRYMTIRVEALSDEPSPVLSRKDRRRD